MLSLRRATYNNSNHFMSYSVRWNESPELLGNERIDVEDLTFSINPLTPLDDRRFAGLGKQRPWYSARKLLPDTTSCEIVQNSTVCDTIDISGCSTFDEVCDLVCDRLDNLNIDAYQELTE